MANIPVGMKYNSLTLTEKKIEKRTVVAHGGAEIFMDAHLFFTCACGKMREEWSSDLPSTMTEKKMFLTDCGCGIHEKTIEKKQESKPVIRQHTELNPDEVKEYLTSTRAMIGRPRGRRKIPLTVSLDLQLISMLEQYSEDKGKSLSQVVSEGMIFYLSNEGS